MKIGILIVCLALTVLELTGMLGQMQSLEAFGAVQQQVELPDAPARKIIETTCSSCHALDVIVTDEGAAQERWKAIVDQMVQYGADVKQDQATAVVQYLTDNFGEGRKILDTSCTTCHGLSEVTKFRGFYKKDDWQDVVVTMVKYGANVKEPQMPILVEYLTRTYGPT